MQDQLANRKRRDSGIEGWTATWYASITKRNLAEFAAEAHEIAARLPSDCDVLEVAPGPGYFAIELARLGPRVQTLDISRSFVEMGQHRTSRRA